MSAHSRRIPVMLALLSLSCLVYAGGRSEPKGAERPDAEARVAPGATVAEARESPADRIDIDTAVSLALDASNEVEIAELAVEKSGAAVREARANRGPQAEVTGSGSYLSNPPEGITIRKGELGYAPNLQSAAPVSIPDRDLVLMEDTEHTYFSFKTTVSQPLFTWGKLSSAVEIAQLERGTRTSELDSTRTEVESRIRSTWLAGRLGEVSVPLLESAVETARLIVDDRNRSFDEGLITRQSILESESQLAGLNFQLEKGREGLRTAREVIGLAIGVAAEAVIFDSPFRTRLPELDEDALFEAALACSPDLAVLESRNEQARLVRQISHRSRVLLPDLSLSVTLDVTGQRVPIVGANWTDSWDANLIVSVGTRMQLFDSGKQRAVIDQAEYDLLMAAEGVAAYEESLELQIRRNVESARSAWHEAEYAKAKLALAHEQEKNARVSFENEVATREEALGAKLAALLAEIEAAVALYGFDAALTSIETLTGVRFQAIE